MSILKYKCMAVNRGPFMAPYVGKSILRDRHAPIIGGLLFDQTSSAIDRRLADKYFIYRPTLVRRVHTYWKRIIQTLSVIAESFKTSLIILHAKRGR